MVNKLDRSLHRDSDSSGLSASQQQDGEEVDSDSRVTDSYLAIMGNCDLDNSINLKSKPSNVVNIDGECKITAMCVEKQRCISQTGG